MDKSKKSLITKIIMAVGVLFVVISVSLFVKNTWNYMTIALKAAGLAVVAGLCFGASALFAFKRRLRGMSSVFYYLGAVMVGAFILMLGGGIHSETELMNKGICLVAGIAVSAILAVRTIWLKMDFDFIMTALSMQMIPWLMGFAFEGHRFVMIGYTLIYLLLAGAIWYFDKKDKMKLSSLIIYWIQTVFQLITFVYALFCMGKSIELDVTALICMTGTMFCVYWMYFYKKSVAKKAMAYNTNAMMVNDLKVCRVIRTLTTAFSLMCVSIAVMDQIDMVANASRDWRFLVNLVAYAAVMVGMAVIGRTEALYIQLVMTMIMTISQAQNYEMPYVALIAAVGFGLDLLYQIVVRKRGWGQFLDLRSDHKYGRCFGFNTLAGLAIAQFAIWLALFVPVKIFLVDSSFFYWDNRMASLVLISLIWLLIMCLPELTVRRILHVANMIVGIFYLNTYSWRITINGERSTLKPQVITLALMAAILALGYIWNLRDKKMIRELQFWFLTVVFSCDVIYTCFGDIYFLLFFGIVAGIILVVAAITSNKRYTILTASSLCIVVLYQTRWFWLSIAWWIYLFVVGVALVTYASVRAWRSK